MKPSEIKNLNLENWLKADAALCVFLQEDENGSLSNPTGREWLEDILEPALETHVSDDICVLFEVARGTIAYGYFYYPLYTVGMDQLFRVQDAAVGERSTREGGPGPRSTFKERLDWLGKHQRIDNARLLQLDAARRLRNSASHASTQSLATPIMAIDCLGTTATILNDLLRPST